MQDKYPHDVIDLESSADGVMRPTRVKLRAWGWLSYVLHLVVAIGAVVPGAQVSVGLLLVALLIDWMLREHARGTWHASHLDWRMRSVWQAGVLYVLTLPFFVLGLFTFNPAWWLVSLWLLYRIVKGMVAMSKGQPLGR